MAKMNGKVKREYWQGVVEKQQVSGLTIKAFCEAHELSPGLLYQWRYKLGVSESSGPPRKRRATRVRVKDRAVSRLLPVKLVPSPGWRPSNELQPAVIPVGQAALVEPTSCSGRGAVQIMTPDGFVLRADSTVSPDELSRLLWALQSCSGERKISARRGEPC